LIAARLEESKFTVSFIDMEFSANVESTIRNEWPRIVMIGGCTANRFISFDLARLVKSISKDMVTVYGGVHATLAWKDTIESVPEIDVLVCGEGEEVSCEIVNTPKYLMPPLIDAPRIENLDYLPFPARHLLNIEKYKMKMDFLDEPGLHIITSRGCPFNCVFCSAAKLRNKRIARSAFNVVDEIEYIIDKYNVHAIKFYDSLMTPKHATEISKELLSRNVKIKWECEVRADMIDLETLKLMKEAGCYYIDVGAESANQEILDRARKGIRIDDVRKVIGWAKQIGLRLKLFFIIGLPGETKETAKQTFSFIGEHNNIVDKIDQPVPLMVFPGTKVESIARQNSSLPQDFSWSTPFHERGIFELMGYDTIPLFIQPTFGIREYRMFKYAIPRYRSARFIIKRIKSIRSFADIRFLLNEAKKLIKWKLKYAA